MLLNSACPVDLFCGGMQTGWKCSRISGVNVVSCYNFALFIADLVWLTKCSRISGVNVVSCYNFALFIADLVWLTKCSRISGVNVVSCYNFALFIADLVWLTALFFVVVFSDRYSLYYLMLWTLTSCQSHRVTSGNLCVSTRARVAGVSLYFIFFYSFIFYSFISCFWLVSVYYKRSMFH